MADETLEEFLEVIRRFRDDYAERFNFDIEAISQDLRERERESGREYVTLLPSRIVPAVDVPLVDQVETIHTTETNSTASQGS